MQVHPLFLVEVVLLDIILCVCFADQCLAIVLSVLSFTDSNYPIGIFKLFFYIDSHSTSHTNYCYFVISPFSQQFQ